MRVLLTIYLTIMLFIYSNLSAQQTVGIFSNTPEAFSGYTLFSPIASTSTYLIDNCGRKVHSWESSYKPGLSTYLLENGILLRTRNIGNSTFMAGGNAGGIEMLDWDGKIIWEYSLSTTTQCTHHDIEYLPNGNILVLVWELKTKAEASQAGRKTSGNTIWSEKVIEIKPDIIYGGGTVVWEWNAWDHLVQDKDNLKDNYGVVSSSPELININYVSGNPTQEDWLHINSVQYNANLDQIILSSHGFSEVWIIDHSTTSLQAASHIGGNSGKGGDLLYRWGNPISYNQGTSLDQKLFKQHDAQWIYNSSKDSGMVLVFNNQAGANSDYSEVNVISPPVDAKGNYSYSGTSYTPTDFHWTYQASTPTDFYASNISGAQRLPNGNTLICEGPSGRYFEVDYEGKTVWEYINPVSNSGILTQGAPVKQNSTFRAYRYAEDYKGLQGKDLSPKGFIESGSTMKCTLFPTSNEGINNSHVSIYPNPARNIIQVTANNLERVRLIDAFGQIVLETLVKGQNTNLNIEQIPSGIYLIQLNMLKGNVIYKRVVVRK